MLDQFGVCGYTQPFVWGEVADAQRIAEKALGLFSDSALKVLPDPHLTLSWVQDLLLNDVLGDAVAAILGNNFGVESTFLIIKGGGSAIPVPLHQDGTDNRLTLPADRSLSGWLSISESNKDNGGLIIYPASQALGYLPYRRASELADGTGGGVPLTLDGDYTSKFDQVSLSLEAGQGVLFHSCLIHETRENTTPAPRIGLNIRFVAHDAFDTVPDGINRIIPVRGNMEGYPLV